MTFESPMGLLLLLLPVALLGLKWFVRRRTRAPLAAPGLRYSSIDAASSAGGSWKIRLRFIPGVLRIATLILLAVAVARPQEGLERIRDFNKGIAIEMVLDRSGSMSAMMNFDNRAMTRLDGVKEVFREFVLGNDSGLPGRPNDLIGMISFARYADTVCPLTLGHGALSEFVDGVELVTRRAEDGTAIGDAVALAAARLNTAEETLARQGRASEQGYEIKSKIIILLTDGVYNYGRRSPMEAAELARQWGIKVYTIGVGAGAADQRSGLRGGFRRIVGRDVDFRTLDEIAEHTGGISRIAGDAEGLRRIYREIDELEKSEVESIRFLDYRERFMPLALAALCLMVVESLLSATLFRRLP